MPGGRYVVTHGRLVLRALGHEEAARAPVGDPRISRGTAQVFEVALPGDVIEIGGEDATLLCSQSVLEPEDLAPEVSRVGKVFAPPKLDRRFSFLEGRS
jgi:hypothetical protein